MSPRLSSPAVPPAAAETGTPRVEVLRVYERYGFVRIRFANAPRSAFDRKAALATIVSLADMLLYDVPEPSDMRLSLFLELNDPPLNNMNMRAALKVLVENYSAPGPSAA